MKSLSRSGQFRVNNGSIVSVNTETTIKVRANGQTFTITRDQDGRKYGL